MSDFLCFEDWVGLCLGLVVVFMFWVECVVYIGLFVDVLLIFGWSWWSCFWVCFLLACFWCWLLL